MKPDRMCQKQKGKVVGKSNLKYNQAGDHSNFIDPSPNQCYAFPSKHK